MREARSCKLLNSQIVSQSTLTQHSGNCLLRSWALESIFLVSDRIWTKEPSWLLDQRCWDQHPRDSWTSKFGSSRVFVTFSASESFHSQRVLPEMRWWPSSERGKMLQKIVCFLNILSKGTTATYYCLKLLWSWEVRQEACTSHALWRLREEGLSFLDWPTRTWEGPRRTEAYESTCIPLGTNQSRSSASSLKSYCSNSSSRCLFCSMLGEHINLEVTEEASWDLTLK